jgi:hypothetical protein
VLVFVLLVVAAAVVATVAVERLQAEKVKPRTRWKGPDPRVWPAELIGPSERTFKADQIDDLGYVPKVVFFGGSRSMRFEPSYLTKKTGLKGFNLAMTNGRPEDAWAFAHYLHDQSPETKLRWIWGIQNSTMSERELEAGLVQDRRLNQYLPRALLREQGVLLPRTPDKVPKASPADWRKYSRDGVVLWNNYDKYEADGRTLERSLKIYIKRALQKQQAEPGSGLEKASRSRDYFERTLGYLNKIGVKPILISMPIHPKVLNALLPGGWQEGHDAFVEYLDSLHGRYDFEFVDLSQISSYDGDPDEFYDGVHIKFRNARKVIDTLVRTYPEQFGK